MFHINQLIFDITFIVNVVPYHSGNIKHVIKLYTTLLLVFPKIIINGPAQVVAGTTVSIKCLVLEGRPSPDIHITTPSGEIIAVSMIMFTATSNDTGNYTCVGSTSQITVTASHHLSVTVSMVNGKWLYIQHQHDIYTSACIESSVNPYLIEGILSIDTSMYLGICL